MEIRLDDLTHPDVIALLQDHMDNMVATSPPESRHALDLSGLKKPSVRFYSGWIDGRLAGCGAIMVHDETVGEVKSMKTHQDFLRQGVASRMLEHLLSSAKSLGLTSVKLETGSMAYFKPARDMYRRHGFEECEPFADYKPDPNSTFMSLNL